MNTNKCPDCGKDLDVVYHEPDGHTTYECFNEACGAGQSNLDYYEAQHEQYLADTYVTEDGTREYY